MVQDYIIIQVITDVMNSGDPRLPMADTPWPGVACHLHPFTSVIILNTVMKIAFVTLGCKLNYAETSTYERELLKEGF